MTYYSYYICLAVDLFSDLGFMQRKKTKVV
jgi:hypothetical protein